MKKSSTPLKRSLSLAARRPGGLVCAMPLPGFMASTAQVNAQASATAAAARLNIPAAPLHDALRAFAAQTGWSLRANDRLLRGRRTPDLSGRVTAQDALNASLAGSGLTAIAGADGAITLRDSGSQGQMLNKVVVTKTRCSQGRRQATQSVSVATEPDTGGPQAVTAAQHLARQRGISAPTGGAFVSTESGVWGVGFCAPDNSHGDGSLGNPWIYVDSRTGEAAGADVPGTGSTGDLVMQSLFPLHSGRLQGLTGRILMSLMGVLVAMFSVTGVLIWIRKHHARRHPWAMPTPSPSPTLLSNSTRT